MRPTATVTLDEELGYRVSVTWDAPVDRPYTGGYILGNKKTAERLAHAINAGAVHTDAHIATDVNGNTYVAARSLVLARRAAADLKRLGF